MAEGQFAKLPYRVGLAAGNHIVVRPLLLEHQPHSLDIVAGEAPIALSLQVAEPQLLLQPKLDARHTVTNLALDEFDPASRTTVIEENPRRRMHPIALAVVDRDPVTVDLGDAIGRAWVERRALALRHLDHLAEHLAARRLVEADVGIDDPNGV